MMDKNPQHTPVSRTPAERAQIAALEQEISQLAALNTDLRAQLGSAHAEIQQNPMQRGATVDDETIRSIVIMAAEGLSISAICKSLGVSRATFYRHRDRLSSRSPVPH